MSLAKYYQPASVEPRLQQWWQESGIYNFSPGAEAPIYSIDTPPLTASGYLHLGHVYSYSQPDFMARFWRMNGYNVFYPMGYDDNGLPTERFVEKRLGITAASIGRQAFIEKCFEISTEAEKDYLAIWQRLGLSVDWRYTYRSIDEDSRRASQLSFLDLYHKDLTYRREAPSIWCPECHTAVAQAELNDLERESEFVTLAFRLPGGSTLPIATTRPELLPACVTVFVHPDDARYRHRVGQHVTEPLFGQQVPLLADAQADSQKGTGAVMCCTFGDTTDVEWWYRYHLPLKAIIGRDGRLTAQAGEFAGLTTSEARKRIIETLEAQGKVLGRQPTTQSIRVHERCDTPVEYIVTPQWFIRVLDAKKEFQEAGERITWHPAHMQARYREWVENLHWDWCISRQRYFGVPFPLWYCDACGEIILAGEDQLPLDPVEQQPTRPCACGSTSFTPETDIMDTWATSSLTPQIAGRRLQDEQLYKQVFPFSLRPQAHDIIRTWAFYTIVKSHYHFGSLPWKEIAISGWGLAAEGAGKISKSRGGGPIAPMALIERYSADALRYWAASAGFGKDALINEEKIQAGAKLITKMWNVARFSERFLEGYQPPASPPALSPTDRWILARAQRLIRRATDLFRAYDYAAAKNEIEAFFWRDLAGNYLELCKERLYNETGAAQVGALYALYHALLTTLKLLAPLLPYITEEIYRALFASTEGQPSIHATRWPAANDALIDEAAEAAGETIVEIATAVRRYKSEASISLGAELKQLQLAIVESDLAKLLDEARADIASVTRARRIDIEPALSDNLEILKQGTVAIAIAR